MKILLKLLQFQKGHIKIGNRRLNDIDTAVWRNNCSVVAQEGFLFSETFAYNITLEGDDTKVNEDRLYQAINLAVLDKLVDSFDKGIHTLLGQTGQTLSKGQTQRVLLARAFYKNTPYLFLDEPTSALDNITATQVVQNILSDYAEKTVIMVTHKVAIAEQMDLIFLVDKGKIIESGTHEDLLEKNGQYAELYRS